MTSVLDAKSWGSPDTRSSPTSVSMFFSSAEAKTSAGAPSLICETRSEEPPKLSCTVTPSFAASNSFASSVKVPFSDAAA